MSKVSKWWRKLWKLINGKKTMLALLYYEILTPCLQVWYPDGVPAITNKWFVIVGIVLGAVGIGHKAVKKTFADVKEE